MAKEKEGKPKNGKTAPKLNLKEKRAAKDAKKKAKSNSSVDL